ncbi:MAG: hypothetical protein FRX48_09350 [Lasallia pustulata]|uniref:Uncharacterized protein n=1 Tax=Lasallia pustulata TaxID=136370 RepID=A0A5M8PDM9_9LECA|nr:MAG: hypothetical protein FRX48_09350 [Lasallia pustulata]
MTTSLLPRRCLSCLRTAKIGRHPLVVYHGQIQWFSSTRIGADTESVDPKPSSARSSSSTGPPFYQCSILSGNLSLFIADRFVLPHLTQHTGQNIPLLVLFVTPSLSSLLNEDSVFFQHILGRLFSKLEIGREIDLLAAVVDSIPHLPEQYLKAVEADIPSNHGLGSDGISLLLSESCRTAPDLWSPRQKSRERESMDIQQRSTVSFKHEPPERWLKWATGRFPPVVYTVHSLELPLANTMFHNAQTSTMFAQRWTVTHNGETPRFERIKQTPLTQQTLNLTKTIGDGDLSVTLPLLPITVPRRVTAAMGNIIRRIQIGDTPEAHAPASEELEKDIHSYFERLGADETRVGVWALVTPQEVWVSQAQTTRERTLFSCIGNGARLHKVLSGGGGWGIKQGLLSLDPHSTYSRSDQASQLMIEDDGDLEAEKQAVLGHLVKPGDVVQFFIHRPKPIRTGVPQEPSHTQALFSPVHGFRTTIFGTIPSTMDAMPAQSTTHSPHTLIHTHFGALSEQGLSLKITTHNAQAPDIPMPVGATPVGTVVQTKLDVPYARVGWIPTPQMFHKQLGHILELHKTQGVRIRRITLYENEADTPSGTRVHRKMVPVLPEAEGGGEEGGVFGALDKLASGVGALDDSPLGRDSQSAFDSTARGSSERGRKDEGGGGVPVSDEGDVGFRYPNDSPLRRESRALSGPAARGSYERGRKDEGADLAAVFGQWSKGFRRSENESEPEKQPSEGTRDGPAAVTGEVPASSTESPAPFAAPAFTPHGHQILTNPAPTPVYRKGVLAVTAGMRDPWER